MADPTRAAYVAGLKMLGRRELSEAQIRQRLARKGHSPESIDTAVEQLREERAIDDTRTAEAMARTAVLVHRRGKLRVVRQIESAGIAGGVARRAVAETLGNIDGEALLETALAKRLRGRTMIANEGELRRLYRYLVGQGFEPDRVLALLKTRRKSDTG